MQLQLQRLRFFKFQIWRKDMTGSMMAAGERSVHSVLIVDDSAAQRQYAAALCKTYGVAVIHEAGNGLEALAVVAGLAQPPQLLICDLEMPTMDGSELLGHLSERGVDLPIVLASSREKPLIQAVARMGLVMGLRVVGTLQKPYSADALGAILCSQTHLGQRSGSRPTPVPVDEAALRAGIEKDEIILHYQPQIDLKTGAVRGVEALARWQHPVLGLIPPDQFIPLAEETGLIYPLTIKLVRQVVVQASLWNAQDLAWFVSVNLSPRLFDKAELVSDITSLYGQFDLSPERLIFEVTESSLLKDMAAALRALTRLRLKGFGLSLDDFGTGFSSMRQLAQIPFTELKIDRSFVHGMHEFSNLQVLVRSTLEMAAELKLETVAEGVERDEDLKLLQDWGCPFAQGWRFAKALSAADLAAWYDARQRKAPMPVV